MSRCLVLLGLGCGLAGCYGPTHFSPSGARLVQELGTRGPPIMVPWGEKRRVVVKTASDGGRVYTLVGQPMCRRFEPGAIRLLDKGSARKNSLTAGGASTALTTGLLVGGGLLAGGLMPALWENEFSDLGVALSISGAAVLVSTLAGMLIHTALPDFQREERHRDVEGGRWGTTLVRCGSEVRRHDGLKVVVTSTKPPGTAVWQGNGHVSLSGERYRQLKKWSASCRMTRLDVTAKATRRNPNSGWAERSRILSNRERRRPKRQRHGGYGLVSRGLESGSTAGNPVRGVLTQSGSTDTLSLTPRAGAHLPIPGGAVGRYVRACESARAQRIARVKSKTHSGCVAKYRSSYLARCAKDCRQGGDPLVCKWEYEDCALLAEGTSINCGSVRQRCLEREGLTASRISACARSCADAISRRTCAENAKASEASARRREALQ